MCRGLLSTPEHFVGNVIKDFRDFKRCPRAQMETERIAYVCTQIEEKIIVSSGGREMTVQDAIV